MADSALPTHRNVMSALQLATAVPAAAPRWELAVLAGRLAELSGAGPSATLTLAFSLVLDAQHRDEPAAWVTGPVSTFFPPDADAGGVDLGALVVVRVAGTRQVLRAADHLGRSGAFSLLVLDLGRGAELPAHAQSRLAGLAARHDTLILCLTRKRDRDPSLGSLVSLRGAARRERTGAGRFACRLTTLKDKRRGPGWTHEEGCRGPEGLR